MDKNVTKLCLYDRYSRQQNDSFDINELLRSLTGAFYRISPADFKSGSDYLPGDDVKIAVLRY